MTISVLSSTSPLNNCQRTFNRYDLIPLRADTLWRIERGVVRTTTWNEEGRLVTLGYWGSLDVVGQPLSSVQPYQIECLTSVEVSFLPSEHWDQALDAILLHIQQSEELLNIIRQEGVHRRLQQMFIWLAHKFGRTVEQGQLIDLRLTHQDIAEVIGATRVTVTRLLKKFEQQGIIYRSRQHFIYGNSLIQNQIIL